MRITCPGCSAQYEVDKQEIDAEGRLVECPECDTVWKQFPDGGVELPGGAGSAAADATADAQTAQEPEPQEDPQDVIRQAMSSEFSAEADDADEEVAFDPPAAEPEVIAEPIETVAEAEEISPQPVETEDETSVGADEDSEEPLSDSFHDSIGSLESLAETAPPISKIGEGSQLRSERGAQPPSLSTGAQRIQSSRGQPLPGVSAEYADATASHPAPAATPATEDEDEHPRPWATQPEPEPVAAAPVRADDEFVWLEDDDPAELQATPSEFGSERRAEDPIGKSSPQEMDREPEPQTDPEEDLEAVLSAAIEEHTEPEPEPSPPRRYDDDRAAPAPGQSYIGAALDRLAKTEEAKAQDQLEDSIRAAISDDSRSRRGKSEVRERDKPITESYTLGDKDADRKRLKADREERSRKARPTRADRREAKRRRREQAKAHGGKRRSRTLRGFSYVIILFAVAAAVYIFSRDIGKMLPQAKPYLADYTLFVDEMRVTTRSYVEPAYEKLLPMLQSAWAVVEPYVDMAWNWIKEMFNKAQDFVQAQVNKYF